MAKTTKTALLDSAERAVRSRGFDGFSYADLSEDVGIRKASIHHHFATKAELSVALMQRYHEVMKAALEETAQTSDTAAIHMERIIGVYRTAMGEGDQLCLCVAFIGSLESLTPAVISEITAFRKMIIGQLTALFERAREDGSISGVQDPEKEAHAVLAQLEGGQISARAEENPVVFDQALALMKGRFR